MGAEKAVILDRGTVVWVNLNPTRGHEQKGFRPCVVVSDPAVGERQRFPLIALVPVTGTPGQGALYPALQPGPSGLRNRSYALVDQLRSVDKRRVEEALGSVTPEELRLLDLGLYLFLGLQIPSGFESE